MSLLLGCVADDFTGATDLANTLVSHGCRTVQLIGVPESDEPVPDAEAIVVALKTRTAAPAEAVLQSVKALLWLREAGARQFFFKYCSTFDSTERGNIGPVAEAFLEQLGDELGAEFTIACPAFPTNGRTVYLGHLFVGRRLLSESGMREHPLTPMTDADLVRFLGKQTKGEVGLVPFQTVDRGATAIREAFVELRAAGCALAVVDAITDDHLVAIGEACSGLPLVTGGSGVAMGLPENFRRAGLLKRQKQSASELPRACGHAAVLSGSCSVATLGQVEHMRKRRPSFRIDPLRLAGDEDVAREALGWAEPLLGEDGGPVLIYASAPPDSVAEVQEKLGAHKAGELVERTFAKIARGLVDAGVRRLVVAGGETAGAVVRELGITGLRIGPEIDPGVPWTMSLSRPPIHMALKSGNFGSVDFFTKSLEVLK